MKAIDRRYIELMAATVPRKPDKKQRNLGIIGFILVLIGGIAELTGRIYGFGIMGAGGVAVGVSLLFNMRLSKRARKEFLDYYDRTGELPPWPEGVNETFKPNN